MATVSGPLRFVISRRWWFWPAFWTAYLGCKAGIFGYGEAAAWLAKHALICTLSR